MGIVAKGDTLIVNRGWTGPEIVTAYEVTDTEIRTRWGSYSPTTLYSLDPSVYRFLWVPAPGEIERVKEDHHRRDMIHDITCIPYRHLQDLPTKDLEQIIDLLRI